MRLLAGVLNVDVYTVPVGVRCIVKHYDAAANLAGSVKLLVASVVGADVARFVSTTVAADTALNADLWTVLNAGTKIRVSNAGTGTLDLVISGTELAL